MSDPAVMRRLASKIAAAGAVLAPECASASAIPFTIGDDQFVVRVMADGPRYSRVHLRAVTAAGEVTLTTQRPARAGALVNQVELLVAAERRKSAWTPKFPGEEY